MGLDVIEIIMEVQDAFGIELPDEAAELPTVGELSQYVSKRVTTHDSQAVWKIIQGIVSEQLQIPIDEIHPGSRWVDDLKAD